MKERKTKSSVLTHTGPLTSLSPQASPVLDQVQAFLTGLFKFALFVPNWF